MIGVRNGSLELHGMFTFISLHDLHIIILSKALCVLK